MSVVIHIDTPVVTAEEFSRRTGMAMGTIRDKVNSGQLPRVNLNLEPSKKRKEVILINMVLLAEMASNVDFKHPLINED